MKVCKRAFHVEGQQFRPGQRVCWLAFGVWRAGRVVGYDRWRGRKHLAAHAENGIVLIDVRQTAVIA